MGIAELIARMQELYARAEAQLAHVDPLTRSRQAWEAVRTGMQDTSALLRQKSGEIEPGWPDDAGHLYASRLAKSSATVRGWEETLAAADIPALVTDLAGAITTTADAVRALWDQFVALLTRMGALAGVPGGAKRPSSSRRRPSAVSTIAASSLVSASNCAAPPGTPASAPIRVSSAT
ncbi:hypothetical protein AB0M20_33390, partial [Actinoplanes sp. NPDC051633]|uniref:hypothetical protein n=1 Tax=Actinoplanes sp. NPDC051633 TaxID=3155670 RepID=UPI0034457733